MKIALLGDIALYGKYSVENKEVYNYFGEVSEFLKQFDHVIGNLETPFCDETFKTYGSKSAYIFSEVDNVEILKKLNIDIVNLANNHIFDYGIQGYQKTKRVLEENNIKYFGIEGNDLLLNENNGKIALTGYCCYSTNGLGFSTGTSQIGVNVLDAFAVERRMQEYNAEGYLNIASIHAGQEHVNYPNYDHIQLARKLATKIPYVYYGHHPHVIQGLEEVEESLIAYSLGNFCFDDVYTDSKEKPLIKQSENNKKSFILSIEIEGNKIVSNQIIPIWATDHKLEIHSEVISESIKHYSSQLQIDDVSYKAMRNNIMVEYLNKRKEQRNFMWYIKRIRLRYFMIIYNAINNKRMYKRFVLDYIEKG